MVFRLVALERLFAFAGLLLEAGLADRLLVLEGRFAFALFPLEAAAVFRLAVAFRLVVAGFFLSWGAGGGLSGAR